MEGELLPSCFWGSRVEVVASENYLLDCSQIHAHDFLLIGVAFFQVAKNLIAHQFLYFPQLHNSIFGYFCNFQPKVAQTNRTVFLLLFIQFSNQSRKIGFFLLHHHVQHLLLLVVVAFPAFFDLQASLFFLDLFDEFMAGDLFINYGRGDVVTEIEVFRVQYFLLI